MRMNYTLIAMASMMAALGASPSHAQSSKEVEEMRQELRRLREEVNTLSQQKAQGDTGHLAERVDQVELKQKSAVSAGDIPGSFRIPGSETSVRVYGFAEAHLIHDFKGTAPGDDFTNLMEQPLDQRDAGYTKHGTRLTAQTSRLGFESSTPTAAGPFVTKLEMDFYAYCGAECNRDRLRIRHAYGEYAGFLVGQTWSTFMDLDNLPEVVDFNGTPGVPFSRRAMIRYTYNNPQFAKLSFALEDPASGGRIPNLVARIDKAFDWGNLNLRLLGHEKRIGTAVKRGGGVGFGAGFKLGASDLLMGQVARVDGDADMMIGSNGAAADTSGAVVLDKSYGYTIGWAHTFSEQLRSNLVFGQTRSRGDEALFDNRLLSQAHLGFIYSPIKNVELGAEYVHGRRSTFDGDRGDMSRLDLMGRYSF